MKNQERAKCIAATLGDVETILRGMKGHIELKRAVKAHHQCLETHARAMAETLSLDMDEISESAGGSK